jgi:hypothetical protein
MVVVKGYADDTRQDGRSWVVTGYAANTLQWEFFEAEWPKMLARHGLPYVHMREMASPTGVYAKWHPPKEHEEEKAAFFADMVKVIKDHSLRPFFSVVRINDLNRFNAETGLNLQPYPLAVFGCVLSLVRHHLSPQDTVEIVFDRIEKVYSKLEQATAYAEADRYYGDVFDRAVVIPRPNNITAKQLLPLQAADFLAWEVQKFHLSVADEWYRLPNKPTEYGERWLHKDEWSREKYGTKTPPARKSLTALAGGTSPVGIVWDYDNLKNDHRLRGGARSREALVTAHLDRLTQGLS